MVTDYSYLIDLIHKSHNAPIPYPTMYHFLFCIFFWMVRCGIIEHAHNWVIGEIDLS